MLGHVARGLFVFLAGAAVVTLASRVGDLISSAIAGLSIVALAVCCGGVIELIRRTTTYQVTTRGVRRDSGILNRKREEMGFRKLQAVDVNQSIVERFVLRTGTVLLGSAASDARLDEILFEGIAHPHRVADLIRQAEDDRDTRFGSHPGGYADRRYGSNAPVGGSDAELGGGSYSGWLDPSDERRDPRHGPGVRPSLDQQRRW